MKISKSFSIFARVSALQFCPTVEACALILPIMHNRRTIRMFSCIFSTVLPRRDGETLWVCATIKNKTLTKVGCDVLLLELCLLSVRCSSMLSQDYAHIVHLRLQVCSGIRLMLDVSLAHAMQLLRKKMMEGRTQRSSQI